MSQYNLKIKRYIYSIGLYSKLDSQEDTYFVLSQIAKLAPAHTLAYVYVYSFGRRFNPRKMWNGEASSWRLFQLRKKTQIKNTPDEPLWVDLLDPRGAEKTLARCSLVADMGE